MSPLLLIAALAAPNELEIPAVGEWMLVDQQGILDAAGRIPVVIDAEGAIRRRAEDGVDTQVLGTLKGAGSQSWFLTPNTRGKWHEALSKALCGATPTGQVTCGNKSNVDAPLPTVMSTDGQILRLALPNKVTLDLYRLTSLWVCANHSPTRHSATSADEMRRNSVEHGCTGWHRLASRFKGKDAQPTDAPTRLEPVPPVPEWKETPSIPESQTAEGKHPPAPNANVP